MWAWNHNYCTDGKGAPIEYISLGCCNSKSKQLMGDLENGKNPGIWICSVSLPFHELPDSLLITPPCGCCALQDKGCTIDLRKHVDME